MTHRVAEALVRLSRVAIGSQPMGESLQHVVDIAAGSVRAADGVGLTVLAERRPPFRCASSPAVLQLEERLGALGVGPSCSALILGRTVTTPSLQDDPAVARSADRLGPVTLRSALALLLTSAPGPLGTLTFWSRAPGGFDAATVEAAEHLARCVGVTVDNIRVVTESQRQAQRLSRAWSTRGVIDQAIGILMSRRGVDAQEAFTCLRQLSQRSNVKVEVVAQDIVDDAVQRARARRSRSRHPTDGTTSRRDAPPRSDLVSRRGSVS